MLKVQLMGVNVSKQSLSLSKEIKFGSYKITTIRSPVEEVLRKSKSGNEITESQYEELSLEKYITNEEYKEFNRLPPSQQKRVARVFNRSPEYKKFKQALDKAELPKIRAAKTKTEFKTESIRHNEREFNTKRSYSNTAASVAETVAETDSFYPSVLNGSNKLKQPEQAVYSPGNPGIYNTVGKQTYTVKPNSVTEKMNKGEVIEHIETPVNQAAFTGVNTAARGAAAAGSGGTSEIVKEAVKAVRKYAEKLKEAVNENKPVPQDTEKPHSSNSAVSNAGMGIVQKVTAAVMALVSFLMAEVGVVILPLLIVLAVVVVVATVVVSIISSIAAALTPVSDSQTTGGMKMELLSASTLSYIEEVKAEAEANDIEEYVNYLMAIIEVESHGNGSDVMQSSESAGLPPDSFSSAEESIKQGVSYFAECIRKAEEQGCDINTAVQSYNYGNGFVDYIASNGSLYSLELAISFAMEKSNGITTDYANEIAVDYNGGWRYAYGNMFYVQLINQYIYNYEDATVQSVIDEAYKFYGWDYVSGGCSPDYGGFDCSGLVQYVYRQAGIDLPRLEKDQFAASTEISLDEILPGDLLFYSNETSGGEIGHVAIYLGDGKTFEAGDPVGVYDYIDSWHTKNLLCAGRVINREE